MSARYVRDYYGVDYKRGDRLVLQAGTRHEQHGVLVSFPGSNLGIRFDGQKFTSRCHPTWGISREKGRGVMGEQVSERESLARVIGDTFGHPCAYSNDYVAADAALAWFAEHRGPRIETASDTTESEDR